MFWRVLYFQVEVYFVILDGKFPVYINIFGFKLGYI